MAIAEGDVVACDRDLFSLLDAVEARGLKVTDVWVKYMTDDADQVLS